MYRDHVWISTLRRLLVAQVFVLLCAPAAWSQAFGTSVNGSAKACGKKKSYSDSNPRRSEGGKQLECANGAFAAADSVVELTTGRGEQDGGAAAGGGSATATSNAFDTITLFPPADYTDLKTRVHIVDHWDISAGGSGTGSVTFKWIIPHVLNHSQKTDTDGTLILFPSISRSNSTSPFQFQIKKTVEASASTSKGFVKSITYTTPYATPEINVPKGEGGGWTCTYASGRRCPF
jgi:hypothetical protein